MKDFVTYFYFIRPHCCLTELPMTGFNVVAAGDKQIHQQALDSLQW